MRKGIIGFIGAILSGLEPMPAGATRESLDRQKSVILTNGYKAPIPFKTMNQRQKRKLQRQVSF